MKKSVVCFAIILVICAMYFYPFNAFAAAPAKVVKTSATPTAPTLGYSPTAPTNGNVTVTVYYPTGVSSKQYKLGTNGVWLAYTGPFAVTSNVYVYARYQNSVGTWSTLGGVNITNIDKTPPANPLLSPSTTMPTNQNVNVSISFSTDSTVKQYKVGTSGVWTSYTGPVASGSNNTIYAKASDAVGNWSSVAGYTISNIDKTPPAAPVLEANVSNPTNKDVSITISYPDDGVARQYSMGASGIWVNYTAPITVSENTTILAKSQDAAGNWSAAAGYTVSNIDKTPPAAPTLISDISVPTNKDVNITIGYPEDGAARQYMLGASGVWVDYAAPIAVGENTTVFAKTQDMAGNWSDESSISVTNIDKNPPDNPMISVSTTELTNSDVTVSIGYSSDSVIMQYKLGFSGVWQDYSAPLTIGSNDMVYARAADNADNWSTEAYYAINNIDKTAPDAPVITASNTASTNEPVSIRISYSDDSTVRQYMIGEVGAWQDYTGTIVLSKNDTIYAKASDAVGNWTSEESYTVSNISKMVLGYTVKYSSTDKNSYNSMVNNADVLNEIATATYTVDGLGNLTGTAPADQISYANSNGIKPNLMVGNNFDYKIAKQLLESVDNRQNLINNIKSVLGTNNYKGVDIDIENIPASCRDNFTSFMSDVYNTLKPLGYGVTVAVPAKTYDSPNAAWTYGFDYESLANYADYIMLMTYDEHYPGGTPGAVASIGWVTDVVDYALTVVPNEKLVLGLAAYGYDWSGTTTKAYSINGCNNLAKQYNAVINLDNDTMSKYFTYTVNGAAHTVWFEDGETIMDKLDLVNSRDLRGVGIWRLGLENTAFWSTIRDMLGK